MGRKLMKLVSSRNNIGRDVNSVRKMMFVWCWMTNRYLFLLLFLNTPQELLEIHENY